MQFGPIELIVGNHPQWKVLLIMIICLRPMLSGKHLNPSHFKIGKKNIIGKFKIFVIWKLLPKRKGMLISFKNCLSEAEYYLFD